jgi:alcohol dehydrogenase class IV
MSEAFRHVDGEQTIVFGPGALDSADELLGEGFTLLTTARASRSAPELAERAAQVVEAPAGPVDDIAAQLRSLMSARRLVAFGGGRVIDTAKALAAAESQPGPIAVPTSLSGAEMTGVHRHARGVSDDTPRSRATVVINDPQLSASQPVNDLAASTANALGHAVTAVVSARSTPIARAVAREAIERLTRAWAGDDPDRAELALGALLAGWAVDRSGLGPHHALTQTAVRLGSQGHALTNAALLPHTLRALRRRAPDIVDAQLVSAAEELRHRAGAPCLETLYGDPELLARAVQTAGRRAELSRVTPPLTPEEAREIYLAAAAPTEAPRPSC